MRFLLSTAIILMTFTSNLVSADGEEALTNYKPDLGDSFKAALKNADVKAGAKYFDRKCSTCHDPEQNGRHNMGPKLWNWYGRQSGTLDDFDYSESMKASGHTWDLATLNYYLENTERAVPGRIMNFRGIKSEKSRANLLLYLMQFNQTKPELPE